jgi:hypothetical protein
MKLNIGITIILSQALTIGAFAPSSSFTTFRLQNRHHREENAFVSRIIYNNNESSLSTRRRGKSTGMKMMFDQLATAINDVAKNIGGRQRFVIISFQYFYEYTETISSSR